VASVRRSRHLNTIIVAQKIMLALVHHASFGLTVGCCLTRSSASKALVSFPTITMSSSEDELPQLRRPELSAADMSAEMDSENSSQARRLQPKKPLWREAPPGREDMDEERGWGDRKKSQQ
jgi:hypothetical protein